MSKFPAPLPGHNILAAVFRYDTSTGDLFWTDHPTINPRMRGKHALTARHLNGYMFGRYLGQYLSRHRVVWKLHNCIEPMEIDHIDGNPANNRIENLRSVTHSQNCRARGVYSTNTSGVPGVSWHRKTNRWYAFIHASGRQVGLGFHDSKQDAVRARQAAEKAYGYTVRPAAAQ